MSIDPLSRPPNPQDDYPRSSKKESGTLGIKLKDFLDETYEIEINPKRFCEIQLSKKNLTGDARNDYMQKCLKMCSDLTNISQWKNPGN